MNPKLKTLLRRLDYLTIEKIKATQKLNGCLEDRAIRRYSRTSGTVEYWTKKEQLLLSQIDSLIDEIEALTKDQGWLSPI